MKSSRPRDDHIEHQMEETAGTWAKSDAFQNFEANLEPWIGFVELKFERLENVIRTAQKIVNDKIPPDASPDIEVIRVAVDQIGEDARTYAKETRFTFQWLCVMLVTFTTTYLVEGLVHLASKNSDLINEADGSPHQAMIGDLKSEMIHRWADTAVKGGPKSWFALLKTLGARDYKNDTQFLLTHLWDTRHRVVNGRGTADALYVKAYASLNLSLGDRIPITNKTLKWWLDGASHFTETTDRFFANYTGPRPKA